MYIIKTLFVILMLLIFSAVNSIGEDDSSTERRRGPRPHGPPPEAYTACEGKNAGDTAQFVSPHGDTVTGTCEEVNDRLVLRPDNPPPRKQRRNDRDDTKE